MDFGTFLLMLGLAYGFGILWYTLLMGKLPASIWRTAAYPFIGIFAAEAVLAPVFTFDPEFGGFHLVTVLIGSIVGVVIDWIISTFRK